MALQSDSVRDQELRQEMYQTLTETRREVPNIAKTQAPTMLQHPSIGTVPFGMPSSLNPSIVHGAIIDAAPVPANTAFGRPFIVPPRADPTPHVLTGFKKLTWCIACGFRKNQHILSDESYGSKCKRDWCAKCGWLKGNHANNLMGPFCLNVARRDSPHSLWCATRVEEPDTRQVGVM